MKIQTSLRIGSVVFLSIGMILALPAAAQTTDKQHADLNQPQQQADLQEQIRTMQSKISNLEAALKQDHATGSSNKGQTQGMKKMGGMRTKQGSDSKLNRGKMSGTGGGGKSGIGMKNGMGGMSGKSNQNQSKSRMKMGMMGRGMKMMGRMKSMGDMKIPSSLPGFPGASHIYHVGADGFFLDHSEHIVLTTEQQSALNKLKEETMLQQANLDRQIEAAEQELWVLTSSDSPDAKKIEDKISTVTKLQGQQRLAYIRAIGEAAKTLTEKQRQSLTGASENEESGK